MNLQGNEIAAEYLLPVPSLRPANLILTYSLQLHHLGLSTPSNVILLREDASIVESFRHPVPLGVVRDRALGIPGLALDEPDPILQSSPAEVREWPMSHRRSR